MKKNYKSFDIPRIELASLLISLFFFQSVLTVAHHTSHWLHDGTSHIVESPIWLLLVISFAISGYNVFKNKRSPSKIVIISWTILVTSSIFWLSGLRTNFYF